MSLFRATSAAFTRALDSRAASGLPSCRRNRAVLQSESASTFSTSATRVSTTTSTSCSSSNKTMAAAADDRIEAVYTPESVAPIGPYSQAIKANGLVFLSGMMPATKEGKQVEGGVAEKTHQMCRNAKAVLEAAGSGLERAVKVTVYFADLDDFAEMNEVYAEYFPHKPARSAIEARRLPAGTSMEMDVIAIQ